MRRLLTILLIAIYSAVLGQDIKPISPNFKSLQSPSFSYYATDSTVWIYKGVTYGWTKLVSSKDLKDTLKYYPLLTKGDLTESVTGLEFSSTRQVIGGATTLTLTSGYGIPTTTQISQIHPQGTDIQAPTLAGDLIGLTQTSTTISIAGKEDKSNKENTTVDNSTIKYPTVNLLKTYADTKRINNTSVTGTSTKLITITQADGTTSTATFTDNSGNIINSYTGKIDVTSSTVSVSWPSTFKSQNYFLLVYPYFLYNSEGKSIRKQNAVYDFNKTIYGFSLKLDTVAGYLEYFAADTTSVLASSPAGNIDKFNQQLTGDKNGVNVSFTLPDIPLDNTERISFNGIRLIKPYDYSISSNTITLTFSPQSYDLLLSDYRTFQGSLLQTDYYNQTLTGIQNGVNKIFTVGHEIQGESSNLILNGVRQIYLQDYTVSSNIVTFTNAPISTDIIIIDYRIM